MNCRELVYRGDLATGGGVAANCPQGRGPRRALSEVRRKSRRRGGETRKPAEAGGRQGPAEHAERKPVVGWGVGEGDRRRGHSGD